MSWTRRSGGIAVAGFCLVLSACTTQTEVSQPCGALSPMQVYTVYFGANIEGRGEVTPSQWARFVDDVIVPALPDGFTVLSGEGVWRDPVTRATIREPTRVLTVAVPHGTATSAIDRLREAYKDRFSQQSVGLVVHQACAAF